MGCEGPCPEGKEEVLQHSLGPGCPGTGPLPHVPPASPHSTWGVLGGQAGPEEGCGTADCVLLDTTLILERLHASPTLIRVLWERKPRAPGGSAAGPGEAGGDAGHVRLRERGRMLEHPGGLPSEAHLRHRPRPHDPLPAPVQGAEPRRRGAGVLLDILQRTGHKGYVAFLESLELYYPQLYRKVTGKEPTRVFSMIIDASGESGLTQLLMSEVMKLQKRVQELTALLSSRDDLAEELRVKDSLLRKLQERVQHLKEACEAGSRELQRCKAENYDLALRLARQSEERDAALTGHRGLLLEIDRLKHSLMKAEDDCRVERKHTLKLRRAMELRPSQELLWELQQEKALLQARVQGLEASVQEGKPDQGRPHVQVPEEDWQRAQRDLQQQAATIFSLRRDLRQAEALRTRSAEEKETFELQCLALRRDSKMYKDRIEAILRQMEEVAIERDQLPGPSPETEAGFLQAFPQPRPPWLVASGRLPGTSASPLRRAGVRKRGVFALKNITRLSTIVFSVSSAPVKQETRGQGGRGPFVGRQSSPACFLNGPHFPS
ncbi:caspase recruitment domain-containing protein 9 isoform X11 [Ovis aries]|uniref:caspase recruitment domain-containing protein 9 isoform X11 n=1 Tax=Ovis aries TaxID=9940 RepID=UPI00100DC6B8|nr:caspase recruitment domain-containing protein 9 isoform X11 [Ovis aries]